LKSRQEASAQGFASPVASELAKLLAETDNAIAAAEQEAIAARERGLDPAIAATGAYYRSSTAGYALR
jgi:hypothetical protein